MNPQYVHIISNTNKEKSSSHLAIEKADEREIFKSVYSIVKHQIFLRYVVILEDYKHTFFID